MRHAALSALPFLLAPALLAACSKSESRPQPVDPAVIDRVQRLEDRIAELADWSEEMKGSDSGAGLAARSQSERLQSLESKIAEFERRLAAGSSTPASTAGGPDGGPSGTPVPAPGPATAGGAPLPPDQPIPEEQIAWFKRVQDEVRKRDAEQQREDRFKRELARAKVTLTPEQEAAVLKLEGTYSQKVRDLYRNGLGDSPQDRDALTAQRETIWNEFEGQVRTAIPASEADKLVTSLKERNRGFYGGPLRPGMNGNR